MTMYGVAEPGDLVIYFGSEWTVHEVKHGLATLRSHWDTDAKDTTFKVSVSALGPPLVKRRDRHIRERTGDLPTYYREKQ